MTEEELDAFEAALGADFIVRPDGTWECKVCGATNRGHKYYPSQEEAIKRARGHMKEQHDQG